MINFVAYQDVHFSQKRTLVMLINFKDFCGHFGLRLPIGPFVDKAERSSTELIIQIYLKLADLVLSIFDS